MDEYSCAYGCKKFSDACDACLNSKFKKSVEEEDLIIKEMLRRARKKETREEHYSIIKDKYSFYG